MKDPKLNIHVIRTSKAISFKLLGLGRTFAWLSALICATWLGSTPTRAVELQGAGSTFAAPLYQGWIQRFHKAHPNIVLSYAAVGSGEGVARFTAQVVDFAASDVAVTDTGSDRSDSVGAQLPVAAGMIVLAYNLPGSNGELKLPRSVYSEIFQGKITKWDDAKILAANPGMRLPAMPIEVVAREDSSGTTYAFTSHMAAINESWEPGVGKLAHWPTSVYLAKGNEGVAAWIKNHAGAIGYVEYGVAKRNALAMASLQNRDGRFIAPSLDACRSSIFTSTYLPLDQLKSMILDPSGVEAYPIVAFSWLILQWEYPAAKWRAIHDFVDFVVGDGQKITNELGYVALPGPVAYRGKNVLARVIMSDPQEASVERGGVDGSVRQR